MRLLLTSLVAFCLCSCGKKDKSGDSPADGDSTPSGTPASSKPEVTPLLCFWDSTVNEHVYTYGDGEPAEWRKNPAFSPKPTVGYVATKPYPDAVPLMRAYCKDRRHYFYVGKPPSGASDIERIESFTVFVWTKPGDGRVPVHACFLPDDKDAYFERDLKLVKGYVDGTLKGIGKQRKLVENYFYVYPTGTAARPSADDKIDAKKLIGKWQLKPEAGDRQGEGLYLEFGKDGKVTTTLKVNGKEEKSVDSFKLEGNTLLVTEKVAGKDETTRIVILKLTDTEMVSRRGTAKEEDTFVRVK